MSADVLRFPVPPSRLALKLEWFGEERSVLLAIWALYFALRVAVLFIDVAPTFDAQWYELRAVALAQGQGYLDGAGNPTALWPPGWPMALSLAYAALGANLLVLGLFNLASAMVIGALTLVLGRRLFGNEAAARMGLLLLAVYPNAIGYVPLALSEVFYTALVMTAIGVLIARTNRWHLVTAGVLFGFATLVKPLTPVLVVLVFAIDWLRLSQVWSRFPRLVGEGLLVLAVALATLAPWTIRNYVQLGAFVPVSTHAGYTRLTGNQDSATGDDTPDAPALTAHMARTDLTEMTREREARRMGMASITEHPGRVLAHAPQKLMRLWLTDGEAERAYQAGAPSYAYAAPLYRAVRYANQAWYMLLMLAFAATPVVMLVRRARTGQRWIGWWLLPYGLVAFPSLVCMVFSGESRLHYPVMPWVCMSAGWLVMVGWQALAERTRRPVTLH